MARRLIEAVPNFSEGQDPRIVGRLADVIAAVAGVTVLDRTSDVDHHRSVITFAGAPEPVLEAGIRAVGEAAHLIDLRTHAGVHPRVGACDVLPFVPVEGVTLAECAELAHRAGHEIWQRHQIPVFFYEAAALTPERQRLELVRRGGFEALTTRPDPPDVGTIRRHPSAGATIVGARKFLIAYNINLASNDLALAKEIARRIRTSGGGLPCLKALGLPLEARQQVQVSMNLTDFEVTPLATVFTTVQRLAADHGVEIAGSELIGLIPQQALEGTAHLDLRWEQFDESRILENRLPTAGVP
ncbi:MAG: glutamate formimidoyltransferase [Acidobacteria bacterium]|nr:glutamate formimidoyltransferase [Acidobacteriota bacterium]